MIAHQPDAPATPSTANSNPAAGHWREIARRWEQVGPPLRPSPEDVAVYAAIVAQRRCPPRALILGVTPELYHLPWAAGTDLCAVDHTQEMIDAVWPGPRSAVRHADWTDLPLPAASRDLAVCDGGLHLLAYPDAHHKLIWALHRVLAPGGLAVFRLFVPPARRESPAAVLADLRAGQIPNVNILKLRLGMALQEDPRSGVQLAAVWDALHRATPNLRQLAEDIHWPLESLLAVETYRDCSSRYHFLGVGEVRRLFCQEPGGFVLEMIHFPAYPLGEQCPMVVFRRSRRAG
jgi:SAM-dependent methyltransferase